MTNVKTDTVSSYYLTINAERDYFRDLCKVFEKCKSDLDGIFRCHKGYLSQHPLQYDLLMHRYIDIEKFASRCSVRFREAVKYIKSLPSC